MLMTSSTKGNNPHAPAHLPSQHQDLPVPPLYVHSNLQVANQHSSSKQPSRPLSAQDANLPGAVHLM